MSGLAKASGYDTVASVLALARLASPTVYNDIANIGDITGTGSRTITPVSAHGVLAARKVGTLLDEGSYSFPLFFIARQTTSPEPTHTDHTNGLFGIYKRGDLRAYAQFLRDVDGTAKFFNAYITKFSEKLPVNGVHTADVELAIDGTALTGTEAGGVATAVFAQTE